MNICKNCNNLMTTKEAWTLVGGLAKPSKMPGWAYGIPAKECKTGKKLRKVKNSTCFGCYALKGCYQFPIVQDAQYRRLNSINNIRWVEAMALLINSKKSKIFRWHDSGDLQSLKHLAKIYKVAKLTPGVLHWLPTREAWTKPYIAKAPKNLVVRFSMPMVDQEALNSWGNTSTVVSKPSLKSCGAFRTDKTGKIHGLNKYKRFTKKDKKELDLGHCGSCRACWKPTIKNIEYGIH
jgi:hypothetical protein